MEVTLPEALWEIVGPISHSLIANNNFHFENDVLFKKVTQAYSEKRNLSTCSYQESNLRTSDY